MVAVQVAQRLGAAWASSGRSSTRAAARARIARAFQLTRIFLIPRRAHAPGAQGQQPGTGGLEDRSELRRAGEAGGRECLERLGHDQMMRVVLEVGRQIQAVMRGEYGVFLGTQRRAHRGLFPDVVTALDAGGVGIQAGIERTAVGAQLGEHPVSGAPGNLPEQRLTGGAGAVRVSPEQ